MSCDGVDIGDAPPGPVASPLLIDLTVIQMAYASWSNGTADSHAVFELFFRRSAHPPARAAGCRCMPIESSNALTAAPPAAPPCAAAHALVALAASRVRLPAHRSCAAQTRSAASTPSLLASPRR